ncbi:MAG: ribonuclease III [Actinomycetia bacterium]|nr:ribonuclease III [Actinomycetes bacterium]
MTGHPVSEVEKILGYRFSSPDLLEKALTHSSCTECSNSGYNYERLEFLGDAVLELVTREYLMNEFPQESEGYLTRRKIKIVMKQNLAEHGRRFGLNRFVQVGSGFDASEGAVDTIAADALEAIIGAIYLDSGLGAAEDFLRREILQQSSDIDSLPDARSALQEYCQAKGLILPEYRLVSSTGPDHNPVFTISVIIDGTEVGSGIGRTRKAAREAAAARALENIERMV